MGYLRNLGLVGCAAVMLAANTARADDLIEGAKACTQYFPTNEVTHKIPVHLLAAIASAESGRWHQGLDMPLPWPWTINAAGKGYYLKSKAEAIAKAQSLMAQGITSMDVGCMQVNLKHHNTAFRDLNEAFEPEANVGYAAKFLRTNYDGLGDWVRATAAYHSRTPNLGSKYLKRIEVTWNRIVERVRQAQVKVGSAPAPDMMQPENPLSASVTAPGASPSKSVRVLQVSDTVADDMLPVAANQRTTRDSVLVVSPKAMPAKEGAPVKVTMVQQNLRDDLLVAGDPMKNSAPARTLDNTPAPAQKKPVPNFVFAN